MVNGDHAHIQVHQLPSKSNLPSFTHSVANSKEKNPCQGSKSSQRPVKVTRDSADGAFQQDSFNAPFRTKTKFTASDYLDFSDESCACKNVPFTQNTPNTSTPPSSIKAKEIDFDKQSVMDNVMCMIDCDQCGARGRRRSKPAATDASTLGDRHLPPFEK